MSELIAKKPTTIMDRFRACKKWVAENKAAAAFAAGFVVAGCALSAGSVLSPFMGAGYVVVGILGAMTSAYVNKDVRLVNSAIIGVATMGAAITCFDMANRAGALFIERPSLPPALLQQLNYDVCFTPAAREVMIGGKPVAIEVSDNVTQTTFFPGGESKYTGEYTLRYTTKGIFSKRGEERHEETFPTAPRPGPYDGKAHYQLNGCKALTNLEFDGSQ